MECSGVKECGKKHAAKGLCKTCYNRKWRAKNPDLSQQYREKWNEKNPDYTRDPDKEYERHKRYRIKNRDKVAATRKKWNEKNPDKVRAYSRKQYKKRKPGSWTIYALTLEDSLYIKYVGNTEQYLNDRLKVHRSKRNTPTLEIHPLVENIKTKDEALRIENEMMLKYETIKYGWNINLNAI